MCTNFFLRGNSRQRAVGADLHAHFDGSRTQQNRENFAAGESSLEWRNFVPGIEESCDSYDSARHLQRVPSDFVGQGRDAEVWTFAGEECEEIYV